MRSRVVLAVAGIAVAAYGAVRLVRLGWDNLVATVLWLGGGVVVHDGVLAPLTIGLVLFGAASVHGRWRAPVGAGFVVLSTVTLTALPVLGRFGARADNDTLLDRPYWTGWLLFATLVVTAVVVAVVVTPMVNAVVTGARRGVGDGQGARRR